VVIDETCVKLAGGWTYLYRAVDQHGQVIDILGSGATMAPQQRGRESDEHADDDRPLEPIVKQDAGDDGYVSRSGAVRCASR
jgi:hypothetical protein